MSIAPLWCFFCPPYTAYCYRSYRYSFRNQSMTYSAAAVAIVDLALPVDGDDGVKTNSSIVQTRDDSTETIFDVVSVVDIAPAVDINSTLRSNDTSIYVANSVK